MTWTEEIWWSGPVSDLSGRAPTLWSPNLQTHSWIPLSLLALCSSSSENSACEESLFRLVIEESVVASKDKLKWIYENVQKMTCLTNDKALWCSLKGYIPSWKYWAWNRFHPQDPLLWCLILYTLCRFYALQLCNMWQICACRLLNVNSPTQKDSQKFAEFPMYYHCAFNHIKAKPNSNRFSFFWLLVKLSSKYVITAHWNI